MSSLGVSKHRESDFEGSEIQMSLKILQIYSESLKDLYAFKCIGFSMKMENVLWICFLMNKNVWYFLKWIMRIFYVFLILKWRNEDCEGFFTIAWSTTSSKMKIEGMKDCMFLQTKMCLNDFST